MVAILNLAILDSAILVFPFKVTHTCQDWFSPFAKKKTSLILSDSTWYWQPSWILPCWIETLPSWIQTPCYLFSDSLKNTLTPLWLWLKLINLTQTHSFSLNLMMAAIFNLAILDWDTLLSSLRFTQKHSHSTLTLTQINSIWLTWRWQPSGILPSWIWPSCIVPS